MQPTQRPFTTQTPSNGPDSPACVVSAAVVAAEAKRP